MWAASFSFYLKFAVLISQNTIQQIISRLDIVEVIDKFVRLKKRGANYLGHCPFHNEKTPSFTVSPSKEIFKCFGCGKSGNTINFLMEHEKYSYVEALRYLAKMYNVEIEEKEMSVEERLQLQAADSLYIINEFARKFFNAQLFDTEDGRDIGLSYLKERGFREDIIQRFQLGYNPVNPPNIFAKTAIDNQYNKDLLLQSGLVKEKDGSLRDSYRGRIIFPIFNRSGKTIGFGARIIEKNDNVAKYLNSPENEIYTKKSVLYGLYQARLAIDKADECLLVEGYLDVISLHQGGMENTVAASGTSVTPEQLQLIKKYTSNCTILLDGDAAGIKAALRTIDLGLAEGLNIKTVLIPDGEDPDSYIRKLGDVKFEEFIHQNKKDFVEFQVKMLMDEAGNDAYKKREAVSKIAASIAKFNRPQDFTLKQDFTRKASQLLQIEEAGLRDLVNQVIREDIKKHFQPGNREPQNFESSMPELKRDENPEELEAAAEAEGNFETEKALIGCLLEFGLNEWDEHQTTATFIFNALEEEGLENSIENKILQEIYTDYKQEYEAGNEPNIRTMMYPQDPVKDKIINGIKNASPEISHNWNKFYSGKIESREDLYKEETISTLTYLKVRKIKKLIAENELLLKAADSQEEIMMALETQKLLKEIEKSLLEKAGTVIFK